MTDEKAAVLYDFVLLALAAYRSDDPSDFLDELEEAACAAEDALELEHGWIGRLRVVTLSDEMLS